MKDNDAGKRLDKILEDLENGTIRRESYEDLPRRESVAELNNPTSKPPTNFDYQSVKNTIQTWLFAVLVIAGVSFFAYHGCVKDMLIERKNNRLALDQKGKLEASEKAMMAKYSAVKDWMPERNFSADISAAIKKGVNVFSVATISDIEEKDGEYIGVFTIHYDSVLRLHLDKEQSALLLSKESSVDQTVAIVFRPDSFSWSEDRLSRNFSGLCVALKLMP